MAVYRFDGEIGADHRLDVPVGIPSGPARIVVISQASAPSTPERFRDMVRTLAEGPHHSRTKEAIDADLRRLRAEWE